MDLPQAIFYVDNPPAVDRDFPGHKTAVWRRIDRLVKKAREQSSPLWQAYEDRDRPNAAISTADCARAIIEAMETGWTPPPIGRAPQAGAVEDPSLPVTPAAATNFPGPNLAADPNEDQALGRSLLN